MLARHHADEQEADQLLLVEEALRERVTDLLEAGGDFGEARCGGR